MLKLLKYLVFFCLPLLLIMACNKNNNSDIAGKGYLMSAVIDQTTWKTDLFGYSYFSANFATEKNRWSIIVYGYDDDTNTSVMSITLNFDFVPKTGRYYFNNTGSVPADSGTMAIYTYYNTDASHSENRWSTGGYVDIDSISKTEMKGSFNFTAKGDSWDPTVTVITEGKFYVPFTGSIGGMWPGP